MAFILARLTRSKQSAATQNTTRITAVLHSDVHSPIRTHAWSVQSSTPCCSHRLTSAPPHASQGPAMLVAPTVAHRSTQAASHPITLPLQHMFAYAQAIEKQAGEGTSAALTATFQERQTQNKPNARTVFSNSSASLSTRLSAGTSTVGFLYHSSPSGDDGCPRAGWDGTIAMRS